MVLIPTPILSRRLLLAGAAAVAMPAGAARGQATAVPTPRQTTGPFYPVDWSGDADGDLVRVTGAAAQAQGVVTHLSGRVLDAAGRPVAGAVVEIWQCDAFGRYRHPRDRADGRDAGFQGRGRVQADTSGAYSFRTIRPVAYPGRTPHIHVSVLRPDAREGLVTQFYVAGEAANARDFLFNGLGERAREAVLMHLVPAERIEAGALLAERDIVLG
jgi:protocatechuate 3,4-dioxygenase beta subunit